MSGGNEEEIMNKEYWANFILCCGLVICAVFAATRFGRALTPKGLFVTDPEPSKEAASLVNKLYLTQYRFVRDAGRTISAEFFIRNRSDRDVKNVNILCEFFDDKESYLDRAKWILHGKPSGGEEKKFSSVSERFIHIDGPIDCRVTDLQLDEEPFFKLHRKSDSGHSEKGHGDSGGNAESHSSH